MQFLAKINPNFEAYHLFKKTNTLRGLVSGVLFKKSGHDYVSDILTAEQITALIGNSGIILEAIGTVSEVSMPSFDNSHEPYSSEENSPMTASENQINQKEETLSKTDKPVVMKMKPEEKHKSQKKKQRGRPRSN